MASTISAGTSAGTAIAITGDTSGILQLQSNGTTQQTIDSTGSYGQVKSGTAVNSTSGTSIDFTSIPSWVKRITVMFNGVSTSGTSNILIQFGAGSITSSGYVSTCVTTNSSSGTAGVTSTAGCVLYNDTASYLHYGLMTIALVNSASYIWVANYCGRLSSTNIVSSGSGVTLGGTLDRVRMTTVNGTDTFDAGSINILYEG